MTVADETDLIEKRSNTDWIYKKELSTYRKGKLKKIITLEIITLITLEIKRINIAILEPYIILIREPYIGFLGRKDEFEDLWIITFNAAHRFSWSSRKSLLKMWLWEGVSFSLKYYCYYMKNNFLSYLKRILFFKV